MDGSNVRRRVVEWDDPVEAALLKVCVNAVGGAMMAAFGESLALAATGGVPLGRFACSADVSDQVILVRCGSTMRHSTGPI